MLTNLIEFLIFVGEESIELWNAFTLKERREELRRIRFEKGWK